MYSEFDLEALLHVEQSFYDAGYQDGFAHGRIHGLIEGRALGREKGFEIWEELGFYEGFALTWRALLVKQGKEDEYVYIFSQRPSQHIRYLLNSISQIPRINPSDTSAHSEEASEELDIPKLLWQIRSRYKVLCSSLGVRPRLLPAESLEDQGQKEDAQMVDATIGQDSPPSQVDPQRVAPGSSIPVWKLDNAGVRKPVTNHDLNF
ncbi:hypothetical protein CPB84DRAFT_1682878 [Gymnopilus junonius]|uniref:Essential protein Yae1 N-terminal domain-containing protein n=1 Tax=Gymnopilus junonius TaxID=109634 RepID=A0A9P5NLL7_GYMJU|nr:hypothetical protein CPB84DRAFT_1682878 [Gymnopilus junonius]